MPKTQAEVNDLLSNNGLKTIFAVLPMLLIAMAITVEGFRRPPISLVTALALLVGGVALALILTLQRRMAPELTLFSLTPLLWLPIFDEIFTAYKTPFILVCVAFLVMGALIYQMIKLNWLVRVFVLLVTLAITFVFANHLAANYWEMVGNLVIGHCQPSTPDCNTVIGDQLTWWQLIFR